MKSEQLAKRLEIFREADIVYRTIEEITEELFIE
jgi:hypothetical protein